MSQWVTVKEFTNRMEAEVVKGLLETHGVVVKIQADDVSGLYPQLNVSSGVFLQVAEADLEKASEILNKLK